MVLLVNGMCIYAPIEKGSNSRFLSVTSSKRQKVR